MEPLEKEGMEEKGLAHVVAAFGYSMAGLRFLLKEEAARLEIVLFLAAVALFAVCGVAFWQWAVLVGLFVWLLMVEAINTAIELIVDRTSPEISAFGKHTKDLGSFAVFCSLVIFCGYTLVTAGLVLTG
ncbi:MAG: diacylglycerol kinase [Ahrensia sp.]|nr:diacylglycerol kinase [Ahrensia sp.]